MKLLIAFTFLVTVVYSRPDSKYTDKYDSLNLEEILSNQRLLVPYIKCLLEQGKCSPEGKELKMHIREALSNNCAKCTERQRDASRLVIAYIINHEPGYWQQLTAKYDPDSKYVKQYENELRNVAQA